MRDEKVGNPGLPFQQRQQVQNLGLDRYIERRDRFVAHDKLGGERERPGDPDALALPAGKLMGKLGRGTRRQPDPAQQLLDLRAPFVASSEAMDDQRFLEDAPDCRSRIERCEGILKDQLNLTAKPPGCLSLEISDLLAPEGDRAARRLKQPHDHPAQRRLSATGLPDQTDRLPLANVERDIVDRLHGSLARDEMLGEVFDLKERGHGQARSRSATKQETSRPAAGRKGAGTSRWQMSIAFAHRSVKRHLCRRSDQGRNRARNLMKRSLRIMKPPRMRNGRQ